MAVIDSLKLNNGTILYPKTLTSAIYNDGGTERLDNILAKSIYADDEIPSTPLPRDADRLGGFAASYFAEKANAQMLKLTDNSGFPKSIASNLNSMMATGLHLVNNTTLNTPSGVSFGIVKVINRYYGEAYQELESVQGYRYTRVTLDNGSTWSAWKPAAYLENGITESGSNPNGSYVKFGDGTMICFGMLDISLANSRGSINKPLPVSLISSDTSQVFFTSKYVNGVPSLEVDAVVIGGAVSSAATSINCYAAYYRNLGITWVINISYFVIGRWK